MKYTTKEDKEQIKTQFNILLAEKRMSLTGFCLRYGESYQLLYGRLTRNSISHEYVNCIIQKLDPKRSLQRINGKLVISKTM
jgi:hypothetical protein